MRLIANLSCNASHDPASSAFSVVPLATRALIQAIAEPSVLKTPDSVSPSCLRITATTFRLPLWFLQRRRSQRFSFRFAGFTYPPKDAPSTDASESSPPITRPLQFFGHRL